MMNQNLSHMRAPFIWP